MEAEPKPTEARRTETAAAALAGLDRGRSGVKISSNREIAVVQADYLALANDLEQAQALAAALELELSGKTNELARFKLIWERTQGDLVKFEQDIDALRKERHALANEAQRARALEHKYQQAQTAREELAARVERLEAELAREREARLQTQARLDAQLAAVSEDGLRATLEGIRQQIDRVLGTATAPKAAAPGAASRPSAERIEIDYSP